MKKVAATPARLLRPLSAGADGRILASEDHVARPDDADYDPSAGELSWEGLRLFLRNLNCMADINAHNYRVIWWREEEERRLNFCEHLFTTVLTPVAEAALHAFGANLMVFGMDPIDPGTPVERLPGWSPIRYYQQ